MRERPVRLDPALHVRIGMRRLFGEPTAWQVEAIGDIRKHLSRPLDTGEHLRFRG